jgi:CRP/FNR family transcriptional regulator
MMVDPKVIRSNPRFAGLSKNASEWLAHRFSRRMYEKKSPLFFEGEVCDRLLIIERGAIKVFKSLESGRELILNIFRSGESVGEVALIDRDVFPASAVAHEDSSILELKADHYFELGTKFPEALFSTIRDLTQRIRAMTQRVQELGSGSVDARLAQLFLSLSRAGTAQPTGFVQVPFYISRQELADMVGVRIETVIRVMSKWQREGVVLTKDNGFEIPSLKDLNAILEQQNH